MESPLDLAPSRDHLLLLAGTVVAVPLLLALVAWRLVLAGIVDPTPTNDWPEHEFAATCVDRDAGGDTVRIEYLEGDEPIQNHSSDVVWARDEDAHDHHTFPSPVEPGASVTLRDVNRTARLEVGWDSGTSENAMILEALRNPYQRDQSVRESV
jgi:hypothetical protein